MKITYSCPKCSAPLKSSSTKSGLEDCCPVCLATHIVPAKPIVYQCLRCRTKLESSSDLAGQIDVCPTCAYAGEVPTLPTQAAGWRKVIKRAAADFFQAPNIQRDLNESLPTSSNNGHNGMDLSTGIEPNNPRADRVAIGLIAACVIVLLVCWAGWAIFRWIAYGPEAGGSSYENRSYSSPSPAFQSDDERLKWRSDHNLPMTDEDIKYEQRQIQDAANKIRESERPIGR